MTDKSLPAHCPRCGWPTPPFGGDDGLERRSAHRTSAGPVRYLRCVCGAWLVEVGESPVAATSCG